MSHQRTRRLLLTPLLTHRLNHLVTKSTPLLLIRPCRHPQLSRNMSVKVSPYGTWKSPVSSQMVSESSVKFQEIRVDETSDALDIVYWSELRFDEGGRYVVCSWKKGDETYKSWTPKEFNARTRVHEYGGGAFFVHKNAVYFSNFSDQRMYVQKSVESAPEPITPEHCGWRYADGKVNPKHNLIYCVREDHSLVEKKEAKEATNTVVAIDPNSQKQTILAQGADFYSCPRVSPDGKRIAWTQWNHPNMPWDSTQIFVADLTASGNAVVEETVKQVMHSQRLRDVPLKPWVIAESQGNVVSGHCNCMAGLGETCTHVSALLFHVETTVRIRDSRTVTEEAAYWKLPTNGKEKAITYAPVAEIDFSSAKAKKRKIDSLLENDKVSSPSAKTSRDIPEPTAGEMSSFYGDLVSVGSKAAVLSIVPEHCSAFVPTVLQEKYPSGLTELYDSSKAAMTFIDLLSLCSDVNISVTLQQAKCVEEATKMQAASKNWFYFRAGRITASKMKRVCRSNPDQPSISLVNEICYPSNKIFATQATKWGCVYEETARKVYLEQMQSQHSNFQVAPSGFLISPDHPHIGASPDGKISCDCCGEGLLEVKYPFCAKDCSMEEYVTGSGACLYQENGQFFVKKVSSPDSVECVESRLFRFCSLDY